MAGFPTLFNRSSQFLGRKYQSNSPEYERDSSKSRDRERDMEREKGRRQERDREPDEERERDGERGSDRDYRHRDHRERSERRKHSCRKSDDHDHHHIQDHERYRDYDRDRDEYHSHRSQSWSAGTSHYRSWSRGRFDHRSRSRSRPRSKSKRISGFDMPPATTAIPGAVVAGQMTGATNASTGTFPATPGQLSALSLMPCQATRHARRVYVGGLSATANEQSVAAFFKQVMAAIGGNTAGPGDAVVNVYINHEKMFAFVDMRSVEEASNAMALNGIIFEGAPLRVRRPTDYNPYLAATLGPGQPNPNLNLAAVGLTPPGSAGVLDGPHCIFVGGVPQFLAEGKLRELLEMFGPLRRFNLVEGRETGNSKGYAFCVYQDLSVTDTACAALDGIKMGDKTLIVRRANQGLAQARPEQEDVLLQAQQQVALQKLVDQMVPVPTKVVCFTQVVSADELENDEEYEDIVEDMRSEGEKYGELLNVIIPRPGPNGEPSPGVGKVFLEYADTEGSTKARQGMHGRKFGGKEVVAIFYPESKFTQGEYDD
ncbi:splicing factor U2af large subunit A isoform X2 [Elaeis guineensis]|uniref:splicing factor U2af large subunit A isoform X2 n=1 Tax=Elaeis guineensis var. tenera TaxID=51953 RepID=UPI003C6D9CB0